MKVPPLLPRFMVLPDGERFVPLEQVIAAHLDQLFPGMEVIDDYSFRVTRNADLTLEEEEADDLLAAVELELRRRRFRRAVRLELDADASDEVRELLQRELDVEDDDVYLHFGPLDLGGSVVGARARSGRPEGPRLSPGDAAGVHARRGRNGGCLRGDPASTTCSFTIRTRASPRPSRSSSARRPPTRRCSRSS